jgi:hypothetical protein
MTPRDLVKSARSVQRLKGRKNDMTLFVTCQTRKGTVLVVLVSLTHVRVRDRLLLCLSCGFFSVCVLDERFQ